ncbi:MAG TPA: hypothetical protein VF376_10515 [Thermoanaerobaculia bacterium]
MDASSFSVVFIMYTLDLPIIEIHGVVSFELPLRWLLDDTLFAGKWS